MTPKALISIVLTALMAMMASSCASRSGVDDVADGIASARESGDFAQVTAMADSVADMTDRLSSEQLGALAVAYVEITNNAVALDSTGRAERAMRNFTRLYDTMMSRDSAEARDVIADIADENPRINLNEIDSAYTRALQQIATLNTLKPCRSSK